MGQAQTSSRGLTEMDVEELAAIKQQAREEHIHKVVGDFKKYLIQNPRLSLDAAILKFEGKNSKTDPTVESLAESIGRTGDGYRNIYRPYFKQAKRELKRPIELKSIGNYPGGKFSRRKYRRRRFSSKKSKKSARRGKRVRKCTLRRRK